MVFWLDLLCFSLGFGITQAIKSILTINVTCRGYTNCYVSLTYLNILTIRVSLDISQLSAMVRANCTAEPVEMSNLFEGKIILRGKNLSAEPKKDQKFYA